MPSYQTHHSNHHDNAMIDSTCSGLTSFSTINIHAPNCDCCAGFSSIPRLEREALFEKKKLIEQKFDILKGQLKTATWKLADVERSIRSLASTSTALRGTHDLLMHRHTIYAGMIHAFLRYWIVLRNDLQIINFWLSNQCSANQPLPGVIITNNAEREIVENAPDLANLHINNWYEHGNQIHMDEEESSYSIIPQLYEAVLGNNMR